MKVIYLCAGEDSLHVSGAKIIYNDKYIMRDLVCDMNDIDLSKFDCIIASPPCNYWSRANHNKNSDYSQETRKLLIDCINIAKEIEIPMIIENVKNQRLFNREINKGSLYVAYSNRHTFWSNIPISDIISSENDGNIYLKSSSKRQGGIEVTDTFERFIKKVLTINAP